MTVEFIAGLLCWTALFSARWVYLIKRSYCDGISFQTASLLEEVNKLKDENFLILHGTADGEILFNFKFERSISCSSQFLLISLYVRVLPKRGYTSSTALSSWADWWRWKPTTRCSCTQTRATSWESLAASSTSSGQWWTTSKPAWSTASS